MGASKKNDRRAANYQARQRQAAAKEAGEGSDPWEGYSKAVWEKYVMGGPVPKPSTQYQFGGFLGNSGAWHITQGPVTQHTLAISKRAEIDAPRAGLPKSESTVVLTGYRMWRLHRLLPDGLRLVAANDSLGGKVEPFEKSVAECKASTYGAGWGTLVTSAQINSYLYGTADETPKENQHAAPHDNCQCGIHAYSKSVPLDPSDKPYVAGEVYLWGKVIVHEHGFRAQYAYPKRLYVIDGGPRASKIADALELTYGVPCTVWDG